MALTRRALGGLTIGGSAAFALSACGGNEGGSGSGSTEIIWAVSSSWVSWNENTSDGNNSYGHQAMSPMAPIGQVGYDFKPDSTVFYDDAIFEGGPELVSEEPMTLKYTLKENAQWSDGKPVRLEDFIFQWYSRSGKAEHANQEKAVPAGTTGYESIVSIEQPEDGSIVVTYAEGYKDPEWSYNGGIYQPSHIADEQGFDWQNDPEAMGDAIEYFASNLWPAVTGPFKPVDSKLGEYVIYEPNENYQGSIKTEITKLTVKVVEGTEAVITSLRNNEIAGSWPSEYSEEELAKVADIEEITTEHYDGSIWLHIDANCNNKFLKDIPLRQAVYTAIDVKDIIAKNFPETPIDPKGSHFFKAESPNYIDHVGPTGQGSGDAEAARGILTEAGYTWNGDDKLVTPGGEVVAFNFRYAESDPVRKTAAELTQAYLAEIGIEVELVAIPDGELGTILSQADFDLVIFGWSGDASFATAPAQFFKSDSDSNFGKYANPAADAEISKVQTTFDFDEAAGYANATDAIVVPEAYTLPLFDEPQAIVYNNKVIEGPHANPFSQAGPLYNVREWKAL